MFKILNERKPRICVFGDIMLDINIHGVVNKIANEQPIPVLLKKEEKIILGGCGNVLNNLYNLECYALYLFSVIGNDNYGNYIKDLLKEKNINDFCYVDKSRKTTVKNRFYSNNHLMFRYDDEVNLEINEEIEEYLIESFKKIVIKLDCLIISDYNKGVCSERLCKNLITICNLNGVKTVIDPKENYMKYVGCTIFKPNRNEVSRFLKKHIDLENIEDTLKVIKDTIHCEYSVITLAEKGLVAYDGDSFFKSNIESKEVIDVTGAGDVVCSIMGYLISILKKSNFDMIVKVSNFLATKSVGHLGTYSITKSDILESKVYFSNKVITIDNLDYIDRTKKIIFTNGCFDLLHRGHIECLKYSKSLGDILVLGLNSDNSIRQLKGHSRPINDLETRISVLESLNFIDYIVVFEELTPLDIIKKLKPHIIVKGGDYTKDDVVGKEFANDVKIYNFLTNVSTTDIINKIKNKSS